MLTRGQHAGMTTLTYIVTGTLLIIQEGGCIPELEAKSFGIFTTKNKKLVEINPGKNHIFVLKIREG